jgi:hypothetical protein
LAPAGLCGQSNPAKANDPGKVYKVPQQMQSAESGNHSKLSAEATPSLFRKDVPPSPDSCPVNLEAWRQGSVVMKNANDGQPDRTPAQQLQLTLTNYSQTRNVVSAVLKVYGYDGSVQAMPADPVRRGKGELSKTVEVSLTVLGGRSASTDLTMRKFGTVSRIEVESVEFADGTSWRAAEQGLCSFTPKLYMLVGSR